MIKTFIALSAAWSTTATAAAPTWVVERGSTLGFRASVNGETVVGRFDKWSAAIRFDPRNPATSSVVVLIASGSARTGDAQRDQSLYDTDWFSVRAFPRATFRSTSIRALGGGRYVANGTLQIRSVERPVSLPFTLSIAGVQAKMQASLTIDRRAFAVGQGPFAATDTVAANVRIDVNLTARRQK